MGWKGKVSLACLGLAVYTLFSILFLNRETPFRGEHWALLYCVTKPDSFWESFRQILTFECFGDRRFQPLAFFPTVLSYLSFGNVYWLHGLWALLLHFGYCLFALAILARLKGETPRLTVKGTAPLFLKYPLEAALLLVQFPIIDLLLWNFFHYVQIAMLLSLAGMYLVESAEAMETKRVSLGFVCLSAASLIYEPFLTLLFISVVWEIVQKFQWRRVWIGLITLAGLVPVYAQHYLGYLNEVARHSTQQAAMVQAPLFEKILYALFKFQILLLNAFWSLSHYTYGNKRFVYEFTPPSFLTPHLSEANTFLYVQRPILVAISAVSVLLAFFFYKKFQGKILDRRYLYFGLGGVLPFLLIAFGRPVVHSVSVSFQFRYFAVISALVFVVFFQALGQVLSRRVYLSLLIYLVIVNCFSAFRHGVWLRRDFTDVTAYVQALEADQITGHQLVNRTLEAFASLNVPVRDPDNYLFEYNAQKCMLKYRRKIGELHAAN